MLQLVLVGAVVSCGTGNQISPSLQVLTGLRSPLVTLSLNCQITYGSGSPVVRSPPTLVPFHSLVSPTSPCPCVVVVVCGAALAIPSDPVWLLWCVVFRVVVCVSVHTFSIPVPLR